MSDKIVRIQESSVAPASLLLLTGLIATLEKTGILTRAQIQGAYDHAIRGAETPPPGKVRDDGVVELLKAFRPGE